jgi:hypothetical protein
MPFKKGEVQHPNAAKQHWKKGESGNPKGKPLGSRNKLTLTKEAFSRGEGLSPADMLVEIARRNFAQATTAGDNLAMKAIIEANKFIEPTADAEVIKENVKDVSTEDLQARVFQLVSNEK